MEQAAVQEQKPTRKVRQFSAEIHHLKNGKFWTHLRTVVIPASSAEQAVIKAARIGKRVLPKGTRTPGLMVRVLPAGHQVVQG